MTLREEHEARAIVRLKAADRERKRLVREHDKRMHGDRRTQHILNAILKRARKGRKDR